MNLVHKWLGRTPPTEQAASGGFLPEHPSCLSHKNQNLCTLRGENLRREHIYIVRAPELKVHIGPENQRWVRLRIPEPGNF